MRAIGSALRRRRRVYLVPTILAFVLIGLYVNVATKRYTAQTQVLLENQETFFTRPDRVNVPNEMASQLDEAAVASQVQLINSQDLARRAVTQLKLVGNDEFDPLARLNPISRVLILLGLMPDPSRDSPETRVADTFLQRLTVFSPPKTRVITIEFTSRDPVLAARAANTMAELYIQEQSAAKRNMAQSAADALSAQIAELRAKLAKADAEREQYRSTTGLLAGTNNMTISGQQLADINSDLSKARALQADAQAKASTIRQLLRSGQPADVAEVTNNDIVRRIWDQRTVAQATLALESRTLLPGHPRIKELTAQVAQYDATLKAAAKQAATTLENEAKIAGARVANLEAVLNQQKRAAGTANGDEVHLRALERIAQGLKDQLESSTTKYEEAQARQSSAATPADARIISRAVRPQLPSYPKKVPFIVFGTVATLIFSVGYVVAAELLSGRATVGENAPLPVPQRRATDVVDDVHAPTPAPRRRAAGASGSWLKQNLLRAVTTTPDEEMEDVAFKPVRHEARVKAPGASTLGVMLGGLITYFKHFGRSAAQSGFAAQSALAAKAAVPPDEPETPRIHWDQDDEPYAVPALMAAGDDLPRDNVDAVAARIIAAHIPGRGLQIVGTSIGQAAASDRVLALSRVLSERGRSLIVDLGTTPTKLAALSDPDNGRVKIMTLPGLSELLAGESSFAEVIHRDVASRLHFIPTGMREADFRDFDLILDALAETYDFIVLLTPAFPQSEIAKVMSPYADFVVLTAAAKPDHEMLRLLEAEMIEAGARDVLVVEPIAAGSLAAREVA